MMKFDVNFENLVLGLGITYMGLHSEIIIMSVLGMKKISKFFFTKST